MAQDAWQSYEEIIDIIQHEIWACESEGGSEEELQTLNMLDDDLRSCFADFKQLFNEKYPDEVG